MTIRNLDHAMAPRSVALIGATDRPGSVGATVLRNLREGGFEGPVWPVNPKYDRLGDLPCFANPAALPEAPELAVIVTPARTVPGLITQLAERGTRAAVVISAGFGGKPELKQAMLDAARPHTFRIVGPNCFGLFVPRIGLNASFAHLSPKPGRLALLSQSGAIIAAVIDWAAERDIGFSKIVSLGEMADVDIGDCLDLLAGDGTTGAVLAYLESVTEARKFMSAARAASRIKPVIVVKSGRHAQAAKAAATHTGALSGADSVIDAAFRRAGLLRVDSLEELFDAAETLTRLKPAARGRAGIVTNGGGAGVLATDHIVGRGGTLAELAPETVAALDAAMPAIWSRANPVDIIGDAPPERYRAAMEAVLADDGVDALIVMACPTALASAEDSAREVAAVINEARAKGSVKPVMTCWLGGKTVAPARAILRAANVATYDAPIDAARALGHLTGWHAVQALLLRVPPATAEEIAVDVAAARAMLEQAAADGRTVLTEPESKAVLAAFGIPTVETRVAPDPAAVATVAADLLAHHDAIAVKLLSRDVTHKSDVGGVALGLATADEAVDAAARIASRLMEAEPSARLDGFSVQPMVRRPHAHELVAGIAGDPIFGPTIVFGAGGTAVEVVADSAVGLPPLDSVLARDLIEGTRVSRLLAGYRDRPAADIGAVARVLVALSQMIADCPGITALDINPLLAGPDGVIALDARIVVDPAAAGSQGPNRAMAIRPYPDGWTGPAVLASGETITVRPIRPADVHLYPEFLAGLTAEDIRFRLLAPRKAFSHEAMARLTQVDYARDMAFVALDAQGALLGVSRLAADPDYTEAEYAVVVRSDRQKQGIGWALMHQLIDYARAEGLMRLHGIVLPENVNMLAMARELGFVAADSADIEEGVRHVVLDLGLKHA